jgi:acetyltransferase-like isoleucine patch superfamily enzyme
VEQSATPFLKRVAKFILLAIFLMAVWLPAAISGFGKWKPGYTLFAQMYAMAPGIVGDYLRIAFYKLTLSKCCLSSRISFGSFFAHPEAELGPHVYIGSNCVLGKTVIGERTQIASGVQILSGGHQHSRNDVGQIRGSTEGVFVPVIIGADCWIGAASVVMTNVEEGATIGAGSVVTRPIPPRSVAVGNPARVIQSAIDPVGH